MLILSEPFLSRYYDQLVAIETKFPISENQVCTLYKYLITLHDFFLCCL